jgi:hypothetical protein
LISYESSGSFDNIDKFLKAMKANNMFQGLQRFGQMGVTALSQATPVDTGETRNSWTYEIIDDGNTYSIIWGNTHVEGGRPIAVLLQYGHGTGTGGYVEGRDYINPALRPLFDQIANEAWKVVTTS